MGRGLGGVRGGGGVKPMLPSKRDTDPFSASLRLAMELGSHIWVVRDVPLEKSLGRWYVSHARTQNQNQKSNAIANCLKRSLQCSNVLEGAFKASLQIFEPPEMQFCEFSHVEWISFELPSFIQSNADVTSIEIPMSNQLRYQEEPKAIGELFIKVHYFNRCPSNAFVMQSLTQKACA